MDDGAVFSLSLPLLSSALTMHVAIVFNLSLLLLSSLFSASAVDGAMVSRGLLPMFD